jgi:hypothetical protein
MPSGKKNLSNNNSTTARSCAASSTTKAKGKRKAIFGRGLNNESPSPENVTVRKRAEFIPPSPPRASVHSLRRTKEKPTCLLFGPDRESLYNGYFFCSNCKFYEDAISSGGYSKKLSRDSKRFRRTANHTDFLIPTDRLIDDNCANLPLAEKENNATVD